jgi:microsomal dipeptidase-like Zn-dependent dipeptidase
MHSIESVMEHFEYCVDLVGIDHVSFGPDTVFGDHVGFHEAYAAHMDAGDEGEHRARRTWRAWRTSPSTRTSCGGS